MIKNEKNKKAIATIIAVIIKISMFFANLQGCEHIITTQKNILTQLHIRNHIFP